MSLIKSKFVKQQSPWAGEVELEIRKYKREVFFDNLWNTDPQLVKSRGAVFIDGKQVVFPMDKCFNYRENGAGEDISLDTCVKAFKKINGYMLNLTYNNAVGWIVSTTGDATIMADDHQTQNKFLNWGVELLKSQRAIKMYTDIALSLCADVNGNLDRERLRDIKLTLTFEVCHPEDRHIVPERDGLHLLCYQHEGKTVPLPIDGQYTFATLGDILQKVKDVQHEGFMVYDKDGNLLFKLKSPFYLAKKWVQRSSSKRMWTQKFKYLDEEYYPIIKWIKGQVSKEEWDTLSEETKSNMFLKAYYYCYG